MQTEIFIISSDQSTRLGHIFIPDGQAVIYPRIGETTKFAAEHLYRVADIWIAYDQDELEGPIRGITISLFVDPVDPSEY